MPRIAHTCGRIGKAARLESGFAEMASLRTSFPHRTAFLAHAIGHRYG
ncbi:hypothetical protein RSSM_04649 [Rhodopirellula sallentina SM41]|uniref:Uncharacterized protein n=1 Tax=Rhodopirellula sallentina SM41 TaxID=1263870 RepID=M5TXE7_9BACT|nr:hypothetical protein RSSM_04649 [Rhodopirellula sallentina SM41]